MAYLIEAACTGEGWAALTANPQNREEAIRPGVENLGGRIHGLWFAFGEYDIIGVLEMPDNTAIAAFMLAAASSPVVKAIKTTPLLTMEEGMEAMRQVPRAGYRPPGSTNS